jgi:hypothetical protein
VRKEEDDGKEAVLRKVVPAPPSPSLHKGKKNLHQLLPSTTTTRTAPERALKPCAINITPCEMTHIKVATNTQHAKRLGYYGMLFIL